jgi:hypothetical protein
MIIIAGLVPVFIGEVNAISVLNLFFNKINVNRKAHVRKDY